MKINNIILKNDGYFHCKSSFYTATDFMSDDKEYKFTTGVNKLFGEIDSNIWAPSYYLSMYRYRKKDFVLFNKAEVLVNGKNMSIDELSKYTCYLDDIYYPLFNTRKSVRKLIEQGIKKSKLSSTPDEIKSFFGLDSERYERRVQYVGNERYRAMAAIGYAYGKQVFCFPWFTRKLFESFHGNLIFLLDMLEELGVIAIVPIGE